MFTRYLFIIPLFFSTFLIPYSCLAEKEMVPRQRLPLYEYGVVGIGARLPHYRGSDEYRTYAFPLPYFVYRGDRVKASRDGVRAIVWEKQGFETGLSVSGNPPVSSDNKARQGMGSLDGIIELGPALRYYFYRFGERDAFFLQANARPAFSIGFDGGLDVGYQGVVADFAVVWRDSRIMKEQSMRFHINTGPQFADKKLHSYFYGVDDDDVTPDRMAYDAKGGYSGWQASASLVKDLTDTLRVGVYGRWLNSKGAVFDDSPLFKTDNNFIVGALFVWTIGVSEQLEK